MRKAFLILAAALCLAACKKNNSATGTITRTPLTASTVLISQSNADTADAFFSRNGLSPAIYQPFYFVPITASVLLSNGQPYIGKMFEIVCNQFSNNLPIFGANIMLYFDSTGVALPMNGGTYAYTGPSPAANDTVGHQALTVLRNDFLSNAAKLKIPGANFADSDLTAALGYADAADVSNSGTTTLNLDLREVWRVSTTGGISVYVDDSTGVTMTALQQ